jgi:hypothetical protein
MVKIIPTIQKTAAFSKAEKKINAISFNKINQALNIVRPSAIQVPQQQLKRLRKDYIKRSF